MRSFWLSVFLLLAFTAQAQQNILATDTVQVKGKVKHPLTLTSATLASMPQVEVGDVAITNHKGEPKGTAAALKGVLIRNLLDTLTLDCESPKLYSEFYLVFKASDGYTVVFSWNEIFNSPTGDSIYLVTEKEGKTLAEMEDRMLLIVPTDHRTGRRYIKGLSTIEVCRAQ